MLGQHWRLSNCEYPRLSEYQEEVLTGVLMADGSINNGDTDQNPRFRIDLCESSKPYLEYLSEEVFPVITTDVRVGESGSDRVKRHREDGFNPQAKAENYSDMYYLQSRRLPWLDEYVDKFTGEWPCEEIELTPTTLKHYYVGDGCWHTSGNHDSIMLSMKNQVENMDSVKSMFEEAGFPPSNIYVNEDGSGLKDVSMAFGNDTSREMFEVMGSSLPGFGYKFNKVIR